MKKILIITFFLLLCMFSLSGNSKIFLKKYGLISEEKKDYIRITIPNSTNRMYSVSYILSTYEKYIATNKIKNCKIIIIISEKDKYIFYPSWLNKYFETSANLRSNVLYSYLYR